MEQHARVICGNGGGHYLNVGFGLGIIDTYIQVRGTFVAVPAAGWLQQYSWQTGQGSSGLASNLSGTWTAAGPSSLCDMLTASSAMS